MVDSKLLVVFVCLVGLTVSLPAGDRVEEDELALTLPEHARVLISPAAEFNCTGRKFGMYADVRRACKVVHVCHPFTSLRGVFERNLFSFVCGDGTVFDQKTQSCSQADIALPCIQAPLFFDLHSSFNAWFTRFVQPLKAILIPFNPFRRLVAETTRAPATTAPPAPAPVSFTLTPVTAPPPRSEIDFFTVDDPIFLPDEKSDSEHYKHESFVTLDVNDFIYQEKQALEAKLKKIKESLLKIDSDVNQLDTTEAPIDADSETGDVPVPQQ